jgi:hypothetical protein
MYVCILAQHGTKLVHKNLPTTPEAFLRVVAPYRDDLIVGVECIFTWYWLADLCQQQGIASVLGHALYMKAIHGGKAHFAKLAHKHGNAKALTVLAHKLARAVYYMLTREQPFDLHRFVSA